MIDHRKQRDPLTFQHGGEPDRRFVEGIASDDRDDPVIAECQHRVPRRDSSRELSIVTPEGGMTGTDSSQTVERRSAALIAAAVGAVAVGALAVGVIAIGKLMIRRLEADRVRFTSVEIDELTVAHLHAGDVTVGSLTVRREQ
ncbi:MAG TPA: hypothetical protein VHZ73_00995 [Vicinamibacterales bacterium]|nr:hypothetical protein [Vicinamibacterales bacterium]